MYIVWIKRLGDLNVVWEGVVFSPKAANQVYRAMNKVANDELLLEYQMLEEWRVKDISTGLAGLH